MLQGSQSPQAIFTSFKLEKKVFDRVTKEPDITSYKQDDTDDDEGKLLKSKTKVSAHFIVCVQILFYFIILGR